MDRGATPPGWEAGPLDERRYRFDVNACERVSIGGYERGPASFVLEYLWGLNPPESCAAFEDYQDVATLLSIWVDDPAIANLMRDTLHMPVVLGTITNEVSSQGQVELQTIAWQAEGGEASGMSVGHPGGDESNAAPVDRFVWHNGTGVSFLDLKQDRPLPDVPLPTSQGTLAPPMRFASQGTVPFVGTADIWKTGDFVGSIYRFGDLECKDLLS